ncbi:MAG: hypothetical protein SGPRY_006317, partial [Prymnesium sp.]
MVACCDSGARRASASSALSAASCFSATGENISVNSRAGRLRALAIWQSRSKEGAAEAASPSSTMPALVSRRPSSRAASYSRLLNSAGVVGVRGWEEG